MKFVHPSLRSYWMVPPIAAASALATFRPSPTDPFKSVSSPSLTKRLNIRSLTSSGTPGPLSETAIVAYSPA